jgi:hypothetical protein
MLILFESRNGNQLDAKVEAIVTIPILDQNLQIL